MSEERINHPLLVLWKNRHKYWPTADKAKFLRAMSEYANANGETILARSLAQAAGATVAITAGHKMYEEAEKELSRLYNDKTLPLTTNPPEEYQPLAEGFQGVFAAVLQAKADFINSSIKYGTTE